MGTVDRPERRRVSPDGDREPSAAKQTGLILPPPIASMPFSVTAAPAWAGLPAIHPVTIQRTGMDPIGVDPGTPRRFAYCGHGAIKLTTNAGSSWSSICLTGVRAASAPRNYP